MPKHKFEFKGSIIAYTKLGEGEPVVLLHGFGEDHIIWQHQSAHLREKYQLLVPDLPGSGASQMVTDMSLEGLAEVVHRMIEHAGITSDQKTIMIGHSMGGYISLAFAEKYGQQLKGLGLFHSTAFADTNEKIITRKKGIEFIETHGAFEFIKTTLPNLFSSHTREHQPEIIEQLIEHGATFSTSALVNYYEAMIKRPDRSALLESLHIPILFVMSEEDNAVPFADILKQSYLPQKAMIKILDRSGHMGMIEQPSESNEILDQFLAFCLEQVAG